ncbi:L-erythro-3,5-diaminohexanoate dehydrogenase [Clostridium tepidiprofundi DSM 19306]|uniref:HTH-type transcriptional regulatory protein TyrR n=1 Tax=Clostridium tepidiprofundi DSM 19306 TaxID=1121338 RepID=A0A151B3N6_9CLOT|nr:sigma 54-interacting transcriptional regulator [Clostridium tepidiprofundi]KYH34400.1 L-erythro-3,5-diaminohexanoate dehydrogenase [Clostridium tepidiprofundi DSM 19306]
MSHYYQYGNHRCLDSIHSFPDSTWKLDNTPNIYENEILIDVFLLNIDSDSFMQIYVECDGNKNKMSEKIMEIVNMRGKLHNPITGTGGILCGNILQIGKNYKNKYKLHKGDKIISLASLTLTPLLIENIISIDCHSCQLKIQGKAILFPNSPLIKIPNNLPLKLVMAVLDEAGAPIQSFNLAKPGYNILIMGASSKIGLMCAYAARKKIGYNGRIIGINSSKEIDFFTKKLNNIFDNIYYYDTLKPLESYEKIIKKEHEFDLTLNCINFSGTEMLSLLCTKECGTIYLASLGSNYKTMCLSAEGIAKDINIIAYKGYTEGHANFTIKLLEENSDLIELLNRRLEKRYYDEFNNNKLASNPTFESNILKDINLEEYVFESYEIKKVLHTAFKVANYNCTVLITGESGVGKEIIATAIHKSSDRNYKPSIKINCGSIPKNLLEAELFGYEKGAFTGADKKGKIGFFEIADKGTLFLDEIGELPLDLQVKLLRAIQEKEIYRVGGITPIHIDVRIIAATNRNLYDMVKEGKFREDLYYRLNVFPIEIPPLRNRKEDIIPLTKHFINKYNKKFNLNKSIDKVALEYLTEYSWPGNIRELENVIQRLLISTDNNIITIVDITKYLHDEYIPLVEHTSFEIDNRSLQEILDEKEYEILKIAKEKYKTTRQIAKALKMSQTTLVRRLKKYNL